jgi:hypothetical protein
VDWREESGHETGKKFGGLEKEVYLCSPKSKNKFFELLKEGKRG